MNPQGFSFPPPPPPPPTQQHQPHPQQQHHHNASFTPFGGQGHHGQRGGRGGGGQFRGRGRGYGNQGGGRGGHFMSSDANRPGAYSSSASVGYGPITYPNYPTQPQQSVSTSHYTASPSQNFHTSQNSAPYPSQRRFSQTPTVPRPSYQQQPSYDASYSVPTTQQAPTYAQVIPSHQPHQLHHQHASPSVHPAMMGPPMRWGFENPGASGSFTGPPRGSQRGPRPFNGYNQQASPGDRSVKHPGKRDHSLAFGKPQSTTPRTPAPPAVPSFGNPLPLKPPPPVDASRKPKKKKRKHNQLGLTPKTEEHESSEEEDDVDEEQKLAGGGGSAGGLLQVTYRGQTSKLQTPEEIAAWIEERRKRFPTQAKVEEKKKAMAEAKKAREEAQRQKESQKQAVKREKKEQDPADAAAKAKRKADKLRRKLMKEEKRIAQAEADAERIKVEEARRGATNVTDGQNPMLEAQSEPVSGENTETASNKNADAATEAQRLVNSGEARDDVSEDAVSKFPASGTVADSDRVTKDGEEIPQPSDISDSSDWTSSSGSDLSSSDSEDSDDDSAPEEATSRRDGPERVPPPPRESKKRVCRHFARNGRCQRGDKCKFLHEMADRVKAKPLEKKGRKGLLQALLDRQKDDENRRTMEVIMWLGENGHLEPRTSDPQ